MRSPISTYYQEVQALIDAGINRQQYHFNPESSQLATIFNGFSPANDGTELAAMKQPEPSYPDSVCRNVRKNFHPDLILNCRNY